MDVFDPDNLVFSVAAGIVVFVVIVLSLQIVFTGPGTGSDEAERIPATGTALLSYPFNGSLVNTAGFGAAANGTGITYTAGRDGQAAVFDGATSMVRVPGDDALDLAAPFRIDVWVRPAADGRKEYILSKHDYEERTGYTLMRTAEGKIGFRAGNGTAWAGIYSPPVETGRWHHITALLNGQTMRLYVDGTPVNYTQTLSGGLANTDSPLIVGRASSYDGDYFSGGLDELRIAADTVEALFPFDDGAVDRSGHGYDVDAVNTTRTEGISGMGQRFDGDGRVTVTPPIAVTAPFTVEAWIRPESTDHKMHVVSSYRYVNETGYLLAVTADDKIEFRVGDGTGWGGIYSTPVNMSTWHHIAGVYADGEIHLYVDGESVGYTEQAPGVVTPDVPTVIGGASTYREDGFVGVIDAVRVSRRALEPDVFYTP